MGTVVNLWDGLRNALTGTGTRRDVRTASHYAARTLTQHEIAQAYSGSGLIRKIVSIPALDMVREWRDPSGLDDDQAAKLFDEEKRLAIRQKVIAAEKLRGMGGGALILGLPGIPSQPAPAGSRGSLAFVHVVSRWHLTFDQLEDDFTRESFGEPAMWRMSTTGGQQYIHPSRVIPFRADTTASLAMPGINGPDAFWGECTVQQVLDAVQDSDMARAAFAALLNKARTLRIGVRGLYEMIAAGQEATVSERLAIMTTAESIHNAIIFDAGDDEGKGGEKIEDATYSFQGANDIINALNEFVAAISDIPATRLLGRAPEGMNANGDSQQADWQKLVRARQTLDLAPCLDRLDRYLVPSALGLTPATYAYDFAPLGTESDKERATRFKTEAEAVQIVANMGIVPERALSRGAQSWMVAEGYLPELEAALSEIPDDERFGLAPDDGEEVVENLEGEEGGELEAPPLRRAANDGKPGDEEA